MRVDLKHRVHIERTSACTAAATPRRTVGYIHIEHFCAGIRHCSVRTYRLEPALPGAAYFGEVHHVQIFTRTPESIGCRRIAIGQDVFSDLPHEYVRHIHLLHVHQVYGEGIARIVHYVKIQQIAACPVKLCVALPCRVGKKAETVVSQEAAVPRLVRPVVCNRTVYIVIRHRNIVSSATA